MKSDATTVTFKSELAGTVEIKWSAIKELVSDKPLAATSTAAPQPLAGTVTAKDGSVTVTTSPTNSTTIAQSDVVALRTPTEQTEYEKSLHPPLHRGWKGGIDLGFALTGGNSETTSFSLAFTAARPTSTDRLNLYANSVYATNNAPGAIPSLTANTTQGGIRYDRNITERLFGFVNADFMTLPSRNLISAIAVRRRPGLPRHQERSHDTRFAWRR